MFENPINLMLALLSISSLTTLAALPYITKEKNPTKKAAKALQFSIVSLAVMLLLLQFSLPDATRLSTFGYPKFVEEVQSAKVLLEHLQDYNKALVQTINALYWFLFIFVVWFLTTLFLFVRASSAQSNNSGNSAE